MKIELPAGKKIYFASDFHLGVPNHQSSLDREKRLVSFLERAKADAHSIFFLGDIFDFWFEYRNAIPKGFIRLQGKLAELADQGLPIYFFTGNHDMWMFDYFKKEIGVVIFREPQQIQINQFKMLVGHGDGLGAGDFSYKLLKKFFNSGICQWLFARLHPNLGIGIAKMWSKHSRIANNAREEKFNGEESEFLLEYCKQLEKKEHHDIYVFGHRHLPLDLKVSENSRYINLGEWVHFNTYAVLDSESIELKTFES